MQSKSKNVQSDSQRPSLSKYHKIPPLQMESTFGGDSDIVHSMQYQDINYQKLTLQVLILVIIQIQKIYQKRFNRRGFLKKYSHVKYDKFQILISNFQKNVLGMTFQRCEKMLETIIYNGTLQNEVLCEEVLTILKDTIRKIQYIDEKVLPREFQGTPQGDVEEDILFSDFDELGLLGSSMLNFHQKSVIKEESSEDSQIEQILNSEQRLVRSHTKMMNQRKSRVEGTQNRNMKAALDSSYRRMQEQNNYNRNEPSLFKDVSDAIHKKTVASVFLNQFNNIQDKNKNKNFPPEPPQENKNANFSNVIAQAIMKRVELEKQKQQQDQANLAAAQNLRERMRVSFLKKFAPTELQSVQNSNKNNTLNPYQDQNQVSQIRKSPQNQDKQDNAQILNPAAQNLRDRMKVSFLKKFGQNQQLETAPNQSQLQNNISKSSYRASARNSQLPLNRPSQSLQQSGNIKKYQMEIEELRKELENQRNQLSLLNQSKQPVEVETLKQRLGLTEAVGEVCTVVKRSDVIKSSFNSIKCQLETYDDPFKKNNFITKSSSKGIFKRKKRAFCKALTVYYWGRRVTVFGLQINIPIWNS
eukprot:403337855